MCDEYSGGIACSVRCDPIALRITVRNIETKSWPIMYIKHDVPKNMGISTSLLRTAMWAFVCNQQRKSSDQQELSARPGRVGG